MFEKGQEVVYSMTGVCTVEDIAEKEFVRNQKRLYYTLKPLFQQNNLIYVPVDDDRFYIRSVLSKAEMKAFLESLDGIKLNSDNTPLSQEDFRSTVESRDSLELAKLFALLHDKKQKSKEGKKKFGFLDEKYMQLAEKLLLGEIATVLEIELLDARNLVIGKIEVL